MRRKTPKLQLGFGFCARSCPSFSSRGMPPSSRRAKRPPRNPRTPVKEVAGDEAGEDERFARAETRGLDSLRDPVASAPCGGGPARSW